MHHGLELVGVAHAAAVPLARAGPEFGQRRVRLHGDTAVRTIRVVADTGPRGDAVDASGDGVGASGDAVGASGDTVGASGDTVGASRDAVVRTSGEGPAVRAMTNRLTAGECTSGGRRTSMRPGG